MIVSLRKSNTSYQLTIPKSVCEVLNWNELRSLELVVEHTGADLALVLRPEIKKRDRKIKTKGGRKREGLNGDCGCSKLTTKGHH